MGMDYTTQTIGSGYNQNPPPDAGETTAANQLNWSKHIDNSGMLWWMVR